MFRTLMIICGSLLTLVLAYYGRSAGDVRAELTVIEQTHINTLDPQQMTWTSDLRVCQNMRDGLTRLDPQTLQPVAAMAELPPHISPDRTTYTFELREGVRWNNGDPLRAQDFVRGWRRAIEPGTAADYAALLADHIKGARAYYDWRNDSIRELAGMAQRTDEPSYRRRLERLSLDMERHWEGVGIRAETDRKLRVTLERPTPYFLELTAMCVMMPVHESIELLREGDPSLGFDDRGLVVYDSQWTKPDYHRNDYPGVVTNGVYNLLEWQFRRRLRFGLNPLHLESRQAALRTVDVLMYENANTAFQAYETGVADWITNLSLDYAGALLRERHTLGRNDVSVVPAFGTYFYCLNCIDDTLPDGSPNPFRDVRVRKAFSISIDREKLCNRVAENENPPLLTLIPPGSIPGYPAVAGHRYAPHLAQRLLDEAGYDPRSSFPTVSILYNTGYIHERIAEAISNMWRDVLGIRVVLSGKETKTFAEDRAKHNFQIARAAWYGDYADPTTFLDVFATGNGNNDSGYSSTQYDALLADAAACSDSQQRMEILARAEALLVQQDFPLIPIYQYTNPQAIRPFVAGIHANARENYPWRDIRVKR